MVDTMLATAPYLPTLASHLGRSQWTPSSRPGRVSTCCRSSRATALSVSCCSGATTNGGMVGVREEGTVGAGVGSSSSSSHFGEVYVASIPLRAPKGVAQILEAVKDLETFGGFQHFMTIIKPADDGVAPCTVLDFQPQNPEDPKTAVAVLMGSSIPGVIMERTLSRLPNQRCWWVGKMKPGLSLEDALEFSRGYNSELSLGINDCRHHTLDLVEYLTGKSMSFIEEVRSVKERELLLAGEPESTSSKTLEQLEELEEPTELETVEKPAEEVTVKAAA